MAQPPQSEEEEAQQHSLLVANPTATMTANSLIVVVVVMTRGETMKTMMEVLFTRTTSTLMKTTKLTARLAAAMLRRAFYLQLLPQVHRNWQLT